MRSAKPGDPAQPTADPGDAPRRPRGISLTTVVWGVALVLIAGMAAVRAVTDLQFDLLTAGAVLLLAAGATLIIGAAFGGRRAG